MMKFINQSSDRELPQQWRSGGVTVSRVEVWAEGSIQSWRQRRGNEEMRG